MEEEDAAEKFASRLEKLTQKSSAHSLNLRRFQPARARVNSLSKSRPAATSARSAAPSFTPASAAALLRSVTPPDLEAFYYWVISEAAKPNVPAFLKDDSFLEAIGAAVSNVSTRDSFWYLTQIVLHFVDLDESTIIDAGILLTFHEFLATYQTELLGFYCQLAGLSVYARNAIACTGLLADVVKLCATVAPDIQTLAAQVIYYVFRHDDPISEEDLPLQDIVSLLALPNEHAVFFVLSALVEIVVATHGDLVSELYTQRVHEFIARAISVPHLRPPALFLAGNMGICDPAELQLLHDCGVISAVIACAADPACVSVVLWALSNCVRSDPELMVPLIPQGLVDASLGLSGTAHFHDAVVFLATLLLFCPLQHVRRFALPAVVSFLVRGLSADAVQATVRVLDALGRVLFLGLTNEEMRFTVPIIRAAAPDDAVLRELSGFREKAIASKAAILREEMRNCSDGL